MTQELTYISNGDYLIPDIRLSYAEPLKRNRFMQIAEAHLRENNPALYNDMILEEKLFPYLKEIKAGRNRLHFILFRRLNMKYLIVVDMQNDFIDGALGSAEAVAIVPYVKEKIKAFEGKVLFTRDTHFDNYLETQEGRILPVPHCIKDTKGWQIHSALESMKSVQVRIIKD